MRDITEYQMSHALLAWSTVQILVLSIVAASPSQARAASEPANLIHNSSFELGLPHFWSNVGRAAAPASDALVTDSDASHGKRSVVFTFTDPDRAILHHSYVDTFQRAASVAGPAFLHHRYVKIVPGSAYTASVYARSSVPGTVVKLAVVSGYYGDDSPAGIHTEATVGAKWQRIHVTAKVEETRSEGVSVQVEIVCPGPGEVHIDAIQLNPVVSKNSIG